MEHLPKKALSHVAAYLDTPTRVLLAVALTAPSSSWEKWDSTKSPSRASKIVISSPEHIHIPQSKETYEEKWDELYFGDFGDFGTITNKLTDADVCGILVCIDAVHTLKKLWVKCANVCGGGLAPLHGSTILEHIDLNRVVEYGDTRKSLISEDKVLPILHSIIEKDENSLKYLCLPKAWRVVQSKELGLFLEAYNRALNRRSIVCSQCDSVCLGTTQRPWVSVEGGDYGVQNFTCHSCRKWFCADCEIDRGIALCACCETEKCAECGLVKTCSDCHTTMCELCTLFRTCSICGKTQCGNCDTGFYCHSCKKQVCHECMISSESSIVKCKICNKSACVECSNNDGDGYVKQCSQCDEPYCCKCGKMECCSMCLFLADFPSKNDDGNTLECFWQVLPSELQQLLPAFATEISMHALVQFWKVCRELVGTGKDYDLEMYKKNQEARVASCVIATDFLLKGQKKEAVYMMFYAGLMEEICLRGPDYVAKVLGEGAQPAGHQLCTYLSWFRCMIHMTQTQADMVCYLEKELPEEKYRDARRLKYMLSKVHASNCKIHCVKAISDEASKNDIPSEYGDSFFMHITACNQDSGKDHEWPACKNETLGWLLKIYVIECNYNPQLQSPKVPPSTRYFRIVHRGKTLFLSSSGKKTLYELGIRDGDTITFGGVALGDSSKQGIESSTNNTSKTLRTTKSKKSKKPSRRKERKKSKAFSIPLLTEDEIMEKHRQSHSRAMNCVLEELNPMLKGIRNKLNNLSLLKSSPKERTSGTRKGSQPQASSVRTLLVEDSSGGKVGKTCYPVLVGEVMNLYKTNRSLSARCVISIDLHGSTKDEALAYLDKNLHAWVDAAMKGEYPWVIPVDIICGGGNQILSEAVKAWIRSKPQVANRPKNNS